MKILASLKQKVWEGARFTTRLMYLCECHCGNKKLVLATYIKQGRVSSCGCGQFAGIKRHNASGHGLSKTPTHNVWLGVLARCQNRNHVHYADYGGRGIYVDKSWLAFDNFLADMGLKPPGLTLERLDNNGPYSKVNCKWATRTEQGRNKRNNFLITKDGVAKPLSQWCEELGLKYGTVYSRLKKSGYTAEEALA